MIKGPGIRTVSLFPYLRSALFPDAAGEALPKKANYAYTTHRGTTNFHRQKPHKGEPGQRAAIKHARRSKLSLWERAVPLVFKWRNQKDGAF